MYYSRHCNGFATRVNDSAARFGLMVCRRTSVLIPVREPLFLLFVSSALAAGSALCIGLPMNRSCFRLLAVVLFAGSALAIPKPHVVSFGKWTAVQWFAGAQEAQALNLKVRGLYVDSHLKEFTLGPPHEITDRLFVVRRAFRVNDALPQDSGSAPTWRWQRGGWLLVDRVTGRVSIVGLPDFDPYYSATSWYRDYAAYCGISDDGKKLYAVVAEVGRRKPILKKPLGEAANDEDPDSACPAPAWQRQPARVTFATGAAQKSTYSVRGHAVDVVNDEEEEEDASTK